MTTALQSPFSVRANRDGAWIEEDFPSSARTGLLHLLNEGVDRSHLSGWHVVAKEVRRITRAPVRNYDPRYVESVKGAKKDAETYLRELDWARVYDFCERLHSDLAEGSTYEQNGEVITITRTQAQLFFSVEIQRLFEEEGLGYEFIDGSVQRRGKRHTIDQTNKATAALADLRLVAARKHLSKALRHFRDRKKPDHENAVKEAVCAVEAAAKELFPDAGAATLGDFAKWAANNERRLLPKTIAQTFGNLYAFRNSGEGVSHGATSGDLVTAQLSEYVLAVAASQIILLADLIKEIEDPPF